MRKKLRLLLILNIVSLVASIVVNYFVNVEMERNVGDVSRQFETLITPAGYAFSIWGVIYLMQILFVGYQAYSFHYEEENSIQETGIWYVVLNIANCLWIFLWTELKIGASVVMILVLLIALTRIIQRLQMERWDAPIRKIVFEWWPIVLYFGWIILASIANIAAYLVSIEWEGWGISGQTWTITLLVIATGIYLLLIHRRSLREAAAVGVWGFVAIAVKHMEAHQWIGWTAIILAIILFIGICIQGYQNRATSPFLKWKRGEI